MARMRRIGKRIAQLAAEQLVQRNAEKLRVQIVQRAVDRGLRLMLTGERAIQSAA